MQRQTWHTRQDITSCLASLPPHVSLHRAIAGSTSTVDLGPSPCAMSLYYTSSWLTLSWLFLSFKQCTVDWKYQLHSVRLSSVRS
jgi:hypothetical protein